MAPVFAPWGWPLRAAEALAAAPVDLFLFLPICTAFGIGGWFGLKHEPALWVYGVMVLAVVALIWVVWRGPWVWHAPALALGAVLVGVLACAVRVWVVASPMLAVPYYGPIQGRIIEIDRSQTDAMRLTLDRVVLLDLGPDQTPLTVRVSLKGAPRVYDPGATVLVTARIAAPESATEPTGFDFRRMAWFQQLGAVGYTASPVVVWAEPGPYEAWINRIRASLSRAVTDAVPGDAGAFASGALTGDRSGISAQVVADLRNSSLAHLLAISGMNMAFIVAFVFGMIRYGLALVPVVALRVEAKKVAAVLAFGVAGFYLALSGANVATTRAFLMVTIMLGAVLLDRRAITLRSVALAAMALMLWEPESLLNPGFQLSFAATVALIAGFGPVEAWMKARRWPRLAEAFGLLVATSVLAGLATTPFAAATFNRTAPWGLVANLMTVPVMSVVMGAGVVALCLAPLGLAGPALWVMGKASAWILWVAHWVSGWEGAVTPVAQPGPLVVPLIALGGLWVVIWVGRARLWGLVPVGLALVMWAMVERPVLLISSDGVLAGVMGQEGRALSTSRGAGFAAESWLANDGDLTPPKEAALRAGVVGKKGGDRRFQVGAVTGVILAGKGAAGRVAEACAGADLVILPVDFGAADFGAVDGGEATGGGGCTLLDKALFAHSGALAGHVVKGGLVLVPVRAQARPWTGNSVAVEDVFVPHVTR
ncbi:ComEC family competence protein [Rhodobacter sp. KR11]|nr:ComEC family competence protein [Rhodobacter sp. KR11]